MKRVLVDQGSSVEVMYPDLYKMLNLKPEDLIAYDSPLVSFEGKSVTPRGQIRLPIQTGSDIVEVDFNKRGSRRIRISSPWYVVFFFLFYGFTY